MKRNGVTSKIVGIALVFMMIGAMFGSLASNAKAGDLEAAPALEWDKTFGGKEQDYGRSVRQTSDGGYIIAGNTYSYGAGNWDVWLIKTDSGSNKEWDKTFGGTDDDYGYSVQQTSDGGYIIAGWTRSYGPVQSDVWLIKTDSGGDKVWDKTFGGTDDDKGYSVEQTSDGGYIIAGSTCFYGVSGCDVWLLIKTDSGGDKVWDKTFGGTDDDKGYSVQQTSDGGYVIAGSTQSYGAGGYDVWLIKVSAELLAVLESIAASPTEVILAGGGTLQLTITATYSDESTADVTATSTYASSDTSVATVSTGGLITGVGAGSATIAVSYTEGEITRTTTVPVTVSSSVQYNLTISSTAGGSVATPGEGTFTYAEGTVVDLMASPDADYVFDKWTGDVDTVASVFSLGTTITMNDNYSICAHFEPAYVPYVPTAEDVEILPITSEAMTSVRVTIQLTTVCDRVVDWGTVERVGNEFSVDAKIERYTGICIMIVAPPETHEYELGYLAQGDYKFTFRAWGHPVESKQFTLCDLTISVEPESVSLVVGETQQLTVTATYTDGSTADVTAESTYVSDDETVATVSTGGPITAVAEGSATVTVSYTEGGITRTTTVPVTVMWVPDGGWVIWLDVYPEGSGYIKVNGDMPESYPACSEIFDWDSWVELEAVPAEGYTFSEWYGDVSGTHNPIIMEGGSQLWGSQKDVTATSKVAPTCLVVSVGAIFSPMNQPSNPSPANHAIGVSTDANLGWSGGSLNSGDAITYDIYFGTSSPPPFKETIGPYPAAQSLITYDPGALTCNTKYYWKIVATDNHDVSMEGPLWDFMTEFGAPHAERILPASVEPGANFDVSIAASGYGAFGQVVETLPSGFTYVSSSLPASRVTVTGDELKFTLLGQISFTYTVTAPMAEGTYAFSGILKNSYKDEYLVGDKKITVVMSEGASATRTLPATVDPGASFDVAIEASGCGAFGQVVETLPDGFSYVSCASTEVSVTTTWVSPTTTGNTIKFTFFGDSVTFTYTVIVKASTSERVYTFSGIVKDEYKVEYPIGGDENIAVGFAPMNYDADGDGVIEIGEVLNAISDYFAGEITITQVLEVIALYF